MTLFRKGGLATCILLALLAGMPVGMSGPAYALGGLFGGGGTTTTWTGSAATPGSFVSSNINNPLMSSNTIATGLNGVGGLNTQGWTGIINGLRTPGALNLTNPQTLGAITNLVNGVSGGAIPANLASAVTGTAGVTQLLSGNLTPQSFATALSNPAVAQALGPLGQAAAPIAALAGVAMNPSALATQAGKQALTQALNQIAPGLGTLVGGLLGGGGATPPTGTTQQPKSPQNPVDPTHTDAGCHCEQCNVKIPLHYQDVRVHTQQEFQKHRNWLVNTFWLEHMLPALQLMAAQLTAVGIMQIQMIGAMLDAKHQLETQRLFQQMMAEAHKDYQPSEGMCTFGTTVRSLAASERRSNISQVAFAQRMMQRQSLSGDVTSLEGLDSDKRSRLQMFIKNYCDQADNANGLHQLCRQAVTTPARRNIDVDYTRNIESRLTLDVSFIPDAAGGAGGGGAAAGGTDAATPDEEDVFSLSANLFAQNIPQIAQHLAVRDGRIRMRNVEKYMDLRAVFAKRSVAQNSFAAITSQRAAGAPESAPYTKAILKELGVQNQTEIEQLLGKNPSYFAQMEILTKKIYQNPLFYTELYDKPVNVERKAAAMQAIGLMQDRDLYNSLLRSEVVLSVLLETMLQKEQEKVVNEGPKRNPAGGQR